MSLSNDIKSLLDNPLFSDVKIKGKDGVEINAHRVILVARSELFKRMLTCGMKEATQDVIEFPEFSSKTLHVILEYLYTEKLTLNIQMVAEAFRGTDFFLLEKLKLQIIEFVKNYLEKNVKDKLNISAKILSQLSESSNNEFGDLLCNSINSVTLKSIEYRNLNFKALEYILSKIKKKETKMFSTSEYDLLYYIILWAASSISEEALTFYKSYVPSSETVKNLGRKYNFNISYNIPESHAKYQSTMMTKVSPLINYVNLERIHPFIIKLLDDGLINSKIHIGKYVNLNDFLDDVSLQWDDHAHGSKMCLDETPFTVVSKSASSLEWIRTAVPISGQSLVEWDIVIEKICDFFWVGICTENGFNVDYNSWLGRQAYGWLLGSNGVICHNISDYKNKYGQMFGENDRITVHLNMEEKTCSFSINGKRYPIAFRDLPDEIYPAVSLKTPGKARIEHHSFVDNFILYIYE